MFRSIQWKILIMFVLLIVSFTILSGTFILTSISSYYRDEFETQMTEMVFAPDFVNQLRGVLYEPEPDKQLNELLRIYAVQMGIDTYRHYYVLNGKTAQVLYSSDRSDNLKIELSANIFSAMTGSPGELVSSSTPYMDYALPVTLDSTVEYIVYVKDTKQEMQSVMQNIFIIVLWSLIFGVMISLFLAYFLSRNIIKPIKTLKDKAVKISEGNFEETIAVRSRDEIGELTAAFNVMAHDLNENVSAIESEKNKIETILRYMTDGVAAFDSARLLIHINPEAISMLGLGADYPLTFEEFFAAFEQGPDVGSLPLNSERAVESSILVKGKHIKVYFIKLKLESETGGGVLAVLQDITEQQKLELSRREFVANVSHELRTPLTTIKSYAETLLSGGGDDETAAHFLEVIDSEADRMTRIVKDLLTLSRLDYNPEIAQNTAFQLEKLVAEVANKFSLEAGNNNIALSFKAADDFPPYYGNRDRIEQVVTNIVSNAIKYTPDGQSVRVECGYSHPDMVITVSDTGIGIPQSDLPRIFERFYRVDKARSREYGGTGLGLAIAKEIVEAHGGVILIDSALNKGTTVTIKLPVLQTKL